MFLLPEKTNIFTHSCTFILFAFLISKYFKNFFFLGNSLNFICKRCRTLVIQRKNYETTICEHRIDTTPVILKPLLYFTATNRVTDPHFSQLLYQKKTL